MNRPTRASTFALTCLLVTASLTSVALSEDLKLDRNLKPLNPLSELDPLAFKAFLQRPLFSASRRVPANPDVKQVTVDATSPDVDIKLLGVVVTPEGSVARIATGPAQTRALRRGDLYRDWQVLSVDQSSLRLGRNGERRVFSVFGKPNLKLDVRVAAKKPAGDIADKENSNPTQKGVEVLPVTVSRIKSAQERVATAQGTESTEQDLLDFFGPSGRPAE